jgi:hypothetical protein
MSFHLGPVEKNEIEQLDRHLESLIKDTEEGRQNEGSFFYIAQQLDHLTSNKHIPDHVKEKLQLALQDLQTIPHDKLNTAELIKVKKDLDDALKGH